LKERELAGVRVSVAASKTGEKPMKKMKMRIVRSRGETKKGILMLVPLPFPLSWVFLGLILILWRLSIEIKEGISGKFHVELVENLDFGFFIEGGGLR